MMQFIKAGLLCFVMLSALTYDWGGAQAANVGEEDAAISRGGRLYENWMVELDERAPETKHPRYQGEGSIAESWRCVTCHGWNYEGVGTIKGVRTSVGTSPATIQNILSDENHGYHAYFQAEDLVDVAKFISAGQIDMNKSIDPETGQARLHDVSEKPFFDTVCAMCHGADGQSLAGISLGQFATASPYLTLHTIFNGHPGAVMPSLRAFEEDKLVKLFSYMQTLPRQPSLVSIVRGGRLYDDWTMETRHAAPMGIHPSYPRNLEIQIPAKQTWLCKECHGWDYRGKDGQYHAGRHFTGISGIQNAQGKDIKKIIRTLKDRNHGYGGILENQDLLDLANFVSFGQVDTDQYIERNSKKALGNYKEHTTFYPTLCGGCHGAKGREIRTMGALGRVANDDPWKALHKILNGHPAEEMPAWRSLNPEIILDLLGYIQSLPDNKRG